MELAETTTPGSGPLVQVPSLLHGAPIEMTPTSKQKTPDPNLVLFQQLILTIEISNAMKRRLNTYRQRYRIDPDKLEPGSDDEPKDPMPDLAGFMDLPLTLAAIQVNALETNLPDNLPSDMDSHPTMPNLSGPTHVHMVLNPHQVN